MKIHLKFNHKENDILKAIECQYEIEEVHKQIEDIAERYLDNEYMERPSQLAELIHNNLDYEVILFLATHSILDNLERLEQIDMIDKLRKFMRDDEHI